MSSSGETRRATALGAVIIMFAMLGCDSGVAPTRDDVTATQHAGSGGAAPSTTSGAVAGRGGAPATSAPGGSPIQAGGADGAGAGAVPAGQYPDSARAIEALKTYLAAPQSGRPELVSQPFAMLALSKADAEVARVLLWEDFAKGVKDSRASDVGATESVARSVEVGGHSLRYYMAVRG